MTAIMRKWKRNPCKNCIYYHAENNTCQSKKVATGREGYVTVLDRMRCKPIRAERKKNDRHI